MKIHYFAKTMCLIVLLAGALPAMATTNKKTIPESREAEAIQLQNRLEEIKALDKSTLTRSEKKALRGEVREIKKELATMAGGVYLSIGAIVLIALLLILLL